MSANSKHKKIHYREVYWNRTEKTKFHLMITKIFIDYNNFCNH